MTVMTLPGWPLEESPYHPGEIAMQERAGMRARAERLGRVGIRDFMPDQHRELFTKLPYLLVGSVDGSGQPHASLLVGPPGFIGSPDSATLVIGARPDAADPLAANLAVGAPVGLLGIELDTRRRNRMNGVVAAQDDHGFAVEVRQSFGNCPQYIQARAPFFVLDPEAKPAAAHQEGPLLSAGALALLRQADTFFIATATPPARRAGAADGVDVSHRGGRPGFIRVTEESGASVLTVPDFRGNNQFNTLGNIALEPRAGILLVDFATGDLLSLTGEGAVIWEGEELRSFAGAQRLLKLRVTGGQLRPGAISLRWSQPQAAPQLAATGSWDDVRAPGGTSG
jgi:predicted pyridoxine 5'-phosphate oxidase superfamily flavin-nucleotide-binding protein